MASNVAVIADIRGLVTQGEDGEEILKNKDPISENGGILTITEFAKIIFEDGREIEIEGPTQIRLDSTFFENASFIPQETIVDVATLPFLRTISIETEVAESLASNLEAQNDARGAVATEQLDTLRTAEEPEATDTAASAVRVNRVVAPTTNTGGQTPTTDTPENPQPEVIPETPKEDTTETVTPKTIVLTLDGAQSVAEGSSAQYTVSVSEAPQTNLTLTVTYTHIDTQTGDYTANTLEVVILAGTTSTTFALDAIDDYRLEGGERFEVSISNPIGGYNSYDTIVLQNTQVTTTLLDGANEIPA